MRNEGFTIVGAVFILVGLSSAAAGMIMLTGVSRATGLMTLQGPRVYFAARAGIEWSINQAMLNGANCAALDTSQLNIQQQGGAPGTSQSILVTITCNPADSWTVLEVGEAPRNIFRVTSRAEFGTYGTEEYVKRQLQALITTP